MGNIKSFCCKDSASDIDEQEDRARILPSNCGDYYNQNNDNSNNNSINSTDSNEDNISHGSTISNQNGIRSIEQSVLDKIYQKMAANVIDVAPGDSMAIQQAEFLERQKAYQAKLSQFKSPLPLKLGSHHHNHHHHHHNQIPKHVSNSFENKVPNLSSSSTSTNSNFITAAHNSTLLNISTNNNTSTTNTNTTNNTTWGSGNHPSPANVTMMNTSTNINRIQEKRSVEYEPISVDEVQLIKEICSKSASSIKNLKITSKEQVVTVFKP